ncbi:hypothetical protein DY000_02063967 [Brassica cretica]|uniref:Protein kinase domain-containing protein n=1 Tax=Brassica cretica TaxID=69181 RepID=A0ABQ7AT45_BRACR|nr:hypothetical protein DY000_02063967 [Brassica cretica]
MRNPLFSLPPSISPSSLAILCDSSISPSPLSILLSLHLLCYDEDQNREATSSEESTSRESKESTLFGYCAEGDQRLLVYEYMPFGSVEDHIHGYRSEEEVLDLSTRMHIALGSAKGLAYLHNVAQPPLIYRDLKTVNILLDHGYKPKLSDFGLAKFGPSGDMSHVSTRVMGSHGFVLHGVLVDCSGDDNAEKTPETAFQNKKAALLQIIEENLVAKTIIFCNKIETCWKVENIFKRLDRNERQLHVLPFHAALAQGTWLTNMEEFTSSHPKDHSLFLVCTDRASCGIDSSGVDHLVLFDFPRDPIEYVRRFSQNPFVFFMV